MPVSRIITSKIERLIERLQNGDTTLTVSQAEALLKDLHNDIIVDLSSVYFLMIPAERRWLYDQTTSPFGQEVADYFSEANPDIAAGSRCLALDEWTAAVFHLMRAVEKGLHALAEDLGLSMSIAMELENWKNIIDQIEKKIRELEALPKKRRKIAATPILL